MIRRGPYKCGNPVWLWSSFLGSNIESNGWRTVFFWSMARIASFTLPFSDGNTSVNDATLSHRFGYRTLLLQTNVFTSYMMRQTLSSATLLTTSTHRCPKYIRSAHSELSFTGSETTSRPDVHATPQEPQSSFWLFYNRFASLPCTTTNCLTPYLETWTVISGAWHEGPVKLIMMDISLIISDSLEEGRAKFDSFLLGSLMLAIPLSY